MRIISALLTILFLVSCGGTQWGNPPSSGRAITVELTQNTNLQVSSIDLCVSQISFITTSGSVTAVPSIREVSVSQSIQALGTVELQDFEASQVHLELRNECSSQKSVRVTNLSGTYDTVDATTARFVGKVSIGASTRKLTLNIQPLIDQFSGITSGSQITTVAASVTGTAASSLRASDTWSPTSLTGAPEPRNRFAMAWTGSEMIVFGGNNSSASFGNGFRYDPIADAWTQISTIGAPSARSNMPAIWSGSEVLIWGGTDYTSYYNDGARYDPVLNSWSPITTTGAPSARVYPYAVWTGQEMIVWGGDTNWNPAAGLADGARYNPATDSWTVLPTLNAPSARNNGAHFGTHAIWTGKEMIVWGGGVLSGLYNTGARFNPVSNAWTPMTVTNAPGPRFRHTTVWTGKEMIIWGGSLSGNTPLDTGGVYDPEANSWRLTSLTGVPQARIHHTAVWTGREMIVWGGGEAGGPIQAGGVYDPVGNTWKPTSTAGAPAARNNLFGVWTGIEAIFWGGVDSGGAYQNTGGRYVP